MGVIFHRSKREALPRIDKKFTIPEKALITKDAMLALLMPVIILGGIVGGLATPTESAGIAAFYAFIVGVFIRKKVNFNGFIDVLIKTGITTGAVMILMGTAAIFSFILTTELFPQQLAQAVLSITDNKIIILLLVNVVLLVFGMFLDVVPALLIITPVFLPLVKMVGVDPLHYGVFCVLNLVIGLATPPVGMCLFVGANIAQISIEKISRALVPFLVGALVVLMLVTYWEGAILWIPRMFGLHD
jgi:C4-dicarboxylate transporter DctM subunit